MTDTSQQLQPITPKHAQAAKASWLAPLIAIILNAAVAKTADDRYIAIVIGVIASVIIVIGFIFAIWAIIGAVTIGPRRILLPAGIGLVVNGFLIYGAVDLFFELKQIAEQRNAQQVVEASDEWIPNGDRWYVDRIGGFAIQFPEEWEVVPNPQEDIAVMALSPFETAEDTFRENITIAAFRVPPQTSFENFWTNHLELLRTNIAGYEEYGTGSKTHNGLVWSWVTYRQVVQSIESRVTYYMAMRNGRIYMVACACHPDRVHEFQKRFDESIASIRIP